MPKEYRAEALLEAIGTDDLAGRRFLIPRAMVARDVLPLTLQENGAHVDLVPAYETVLPAERSEEIMGLLEQGKIDCLTFTSSSTVENFFSLLDRDALAALLHPVTIACIGPITAQTAEKHGLKVDIIPADYTIAGLAQAICAHFAGQ